MSAGYPGLNMGNDGGSCTKFCARRSSRRSFRSVLSDVTCNGDEGDGSSSSNVSWGSWFWGLGSPADGVGMFGTTSLHYR